MYKTIVAIDPGATGAKAIRNNGQISISKLESPQRTYELLKRLKMHENSPIVFLEKITLNKHDFRNMRFHQISKLIASREKIEGYCQALNIPWVDVYSVSWVAFHKLPKCDEQFRKERNLRCAKYHFPGIKIAKYQSDAMLILNYADKMLLYNPEKLNINGKNT